MGTERDVTAMKSEKRVSESLIEQTYLLMPKHINGYGKLFGGQLMAWIDSTAAIAAMRHANCEVTTAAVDNLDFKAGALAGEVIVLVGRVTHVGRTSIEVRVDTYVESMDGNRRMINKAYLVMVAVDSEGRPQPVPALICETERDRQEWEGGERRRVLRKQRRIEGF